MIRRSLLPAFALGLLLAPLAAPTWGQHHVVSGKVDYEPAPRGGDPDPPEGCVGVPAKVSMSGNAVTFSPATITIDPGQPVCWTWSGTNDQHNITANDTSFTSGPPANNGNFQKTFQTPGTYGYHCQVHGSPTAGMRGTIVVRDLDGGSGPGTLELTSAYTVDENAGSLNVTVERVGGSEGAASVKYQTAPGTAKSGKDYTTRKGTLSWANGDQEPKSFAVPLKNDTAIETDESFTVKLTKATGATLGGAIATVTVHDDDGPQCDSELLAPSKLRASGRSAGEIHLTWVDESTATDSFRIERRSPGGEFRKIAAVAAGENSFNDAGLPGGSTFQYRIRAEGIDGVSAFSAIAAGATDGPTGPCDETRSALCLKEGRFEATVEWRRSDAEANRQAKRVAPPSETSGSGLFSFSAGDDVQLLLNVVDGCADNDRYGIHLAAVSDAEITVRVRDTQTGRTWVHFSPAGSLPAPVRDLEALDTCP